MLGAPLSSIGLDPLETIALLENQFAASEVNWEAILAVQYRTALRKPRTIIDVGAHIGQHVDQFVQMGATRIVAFEPVPRLAADLSSKFGSDGRLEVHQVALGSKSGRSDFHVDHVRPGESGMRSRSDRPVTREVEVREVEVMTLDQFPVTDVDYIKVDVEGAELDVLSGAESTVRMWRPLISVEHGWQSYRGYGRDKRSLLDWAIAHEYVVCDLFGSVLSGSTYDECVDRFYWDYLLLPDDNLRLRNRLQLSGRAILDSISKYVQPSEQ
jgi:FkbM family methyltransferase